MVMDTHTARRIIEHMYDCTATIIECRQVQDEKTKLTSLEEVTVYENQPCKISVESIMSVEETEAVAKLSQKVKLFIAPELDIKPHSKINITKDGKSVTYANSGVPGIYDTHQEIMLTAFERWA